MRRLLCWLGLHRWEPYGLSPTFTEITVERCRHCRVFCHVWRDEADDWGDVRRKVLDK